MELRSMSVLKKFMKWKQCDEDERWAEHAIKKLLKMLKERKDLIQELQRALSCPGAPSKCVPVPRTLDGRLQILNRKGYPHVIYCRLWRWPDLQSHHELEALPRCQFAFSNHLNDVCVNPYHYERVDATVRTPPKHNDFVPSCSFLSFQRLGELTTPQTITFTESGFAGSNQEVPRITFSILQPQNSDLGELQLQEHNSCHNYLSKELNIEEHQPPELQSLPQPTEWQLLPQPAEWQLLPQPAQSQLLPQPVTWWLLPQPAELQLLPQPAQLQLLPQPADLQLLPQTTESQLLSQPTESQQSLQLTESQPSPQPTESQLSLQPTESQPSPQSTESHLLPQPAQWQLLSQPTESQSSHQSTESQLSPQPTESYSSPKPTKSELSPQPTESQLLPEPTESQPSPQPAEWQLLPQPTESHPSPQFTKSEPSPQPTESQLLLQPTESHPSPQPKKSEPSPHLTESQLLPEPTKSQPSPQHSESQLLPQPTESRPSPQATKSEPSPQPTESQQLPEPTESQPSSQLSELQLLHQLINYEEQQCWASIAYYELNHRVGEIFYCRNTSIVVDGFTNPDNNGARLCLGLLRNIRRNWIINKIREQIGKGIRINYVNGQVYVECLSNLPIFVQSQISNSINNVYPSTVRKISPGSSFKIFDNAEFSQLLFECVNCDYNSVFQLTEMCSIQISFVKGWGAQFGSEDITSAPAWVEIQLFQPLQWLDRVLLEMGGPPEDVRQIF